MNHAIQLGVAEIWGRLAHLSRHLTLVVAVLAAGCTPNRSFHGNDVSRDRAIVGVNSIKKAQNHEVAFIELGEQGSFRDITQLEKALELIQAKRRPLVVTYLHGWHNHAASDDVHRFNEMLNKLASYQDPSRGGFEVVGVYLGWRGESISLPVINSLTFWNRKSAAERLASNNDCFDALCSITRAVRSKNGSSNRRNGYSVLLGHSFGGLILERAVAHGMILNSHLGVADNPAGDLIITVNPASDTILTRQLMASLLSRYEYDSDRNAYVGRSSRRLVLPGHRQLIVALSAENDRATGTMFPIGTSLAILTKQWDRVPTPGENQYAVSEKRFFVSTPGKNDYLVTHDLVDWQERAVNDLGAANAFQANLARGFENDRIFTDQESPRNGTPHVREWQLRRRAMIPQSPYWIINLSKFIANDHGGIWNDNMTAVIVAVFRENFPLEPKRALEPASVPKATDEMRDRDFKALRVPQGAKAKDRPRLENY